MHALDHKNILKFFAWWVCRPEHSACCRSFKGRGTLLTGHGGCAWCGRYETTNHLWLILEYCVGGDLLSLLRTDVRLPEASVHDFARDLVVALQYLHANSIVYCDLKPSNILLDENGRLKLGGFGLSRRLSDINKTPYTTLPQAGSDTGWRSGLTMVLLTDGLSRPAYKSHARLITFLLCAMCFAFSHTGKAWNALLYGTRAFLRRRHTLHSIRPVGPGLRSL